MTSQFHIPHNTRKTICKFMVHLTGHSESGIGEKWGGWHQYDEYQTSYLLYDIVIQHRHHGSWPTFAVYWVDQRSSTGRRQSHCCAQRNGLVFLLLCWMDKMQERIWETWVPVFIGMVWFGRKWNEDGSVRRVVVLISNCILTFVGWLWGGFERREGRVLGK